MTFNLPTKDQLARQEARRSRRKRKQKSDLHSRIINWKFESAKKYLTEDDPDDLKDLVYALARMFGNSGWIEGDLGILVNAALRATVHDEQESK